VLAAPAWSVGWHGPLAQTRHWWPRAGSGNRRRQRRRSAPLLRTGAAPFGSAALDAPNVFVAKAAEPVALIAVNPLWTRLSSREGATAPALHQVVPASLEDELRGWIHYNVSLLPDDGKRLMVRLDLVVPDSYRQDYARAHAKYQQQLREREKKIEAAQAARETARDADGQSSSTAVSLYSSVGSSYPYPPSPLSPQLRFLAYGTSVDQLLDIVDGFFFCCRTSQHRPRLMIRSCNSFASLGKRCGPKISERSCSSFSMTVT
jgi:hypothetical protein